VPDRYDVPITSMIDMVAGQPTGNHAARILSIDVSGDAATGKLAESDFWGQDFVDYFLLARIDDEWQIVAKSFDNPGNRLRKVGSGLADRRSERGEERNHICRTGKHQVGSRGQFAGRVIERRIDACDRHTRDASVPQQFDRVEGRKVAEVIARVDDRPSLPLAGE
jgi:hypothetical protein